MPSVSEDTRLVGRDEQLARVRAFVHGTATEALVLVIEGSAGIGKTALWRAALASAPGARTSRARETEASFAFAGVADLLTPLPEAILTALPPPQRRALEVALLLRDAHGQPPAPHVVGAATLTTLRLLAPVVVAVDDVQWLDSASASALEFALRRLRVENGVRALLTLRTPADDLARRLLDERAERVTLGPLTFGALQRLVAGRLGRAVPRHIARRIHEVSGGNPFFALELADNLVARGVERMAPRDVRVPDSIASIVAERLANVDASGRAAVLATALLAAPRVSAVTAALGTGDGIAIAADAHLLEVEGETLRLAHPLYGSVLRERTPATELRRLHQTLAELPLAPEERIRHLALGSEPPDADVAQALEDAADDAAARAAGIAAAELTEDAWRFTPLDSPRRTERAVAAARKYRRVGLYPYARRLLEHALPASTGQVRVQILFELARSGPVERLEILEEALPEAEGALRAEILAEMADTAATGRAERIPSARAWAAEAVALARASADGALLSRTLFQLAWTDALMGEDPEPILLEADLSASQNDTFDHPDRVRAVRASWRGDTGRARTLLTGLLERAREREEEYAQLIFLNHLAELDVRRGDYRAFATATQRLLDVAAPFGISAAVAGRARATAAVATGDITSAAAEVAAIEGTGSDAVGWQALEARRLAGVAALFAGDAARAVDLLRGVDDHVRAAGIVDPAVFPVAPDLAEALLLEGKRGGAAAVLDRFEEIARSLDHPWAAATARRTRALMADDATAAGLLDDAVARLESLDHPLDLARAQLALGVLHRRNRRLRDARKALEAARGLFDELGVSVLAARAAAELDRIGGRRTATGLTPTERRVAALVADGLSNKQIAGRLVVSVAAVEAHLTRIYAKLGVRGRTELAVKVSGSPD